jgi:hypothetical protein
VKLSDMRPGMLIRYVERDPFTSIVLKVSKSSFVTQPTGKGGCIQYPGGWSMPRIQYSAGVAEHMEPVPGAEDEDVCTHGKNGAHVRRPRCP